MKKILIIGESCKDIFVYCNANRLAPDLPIPVLSVIEKKENPGMAKNVERNVKNIMDECDIITNPGWENVTKTRYMHHTSNHAFLRVDADHKISRIDITKVPLKKYEIIAVSDYNKGFLTEEDIKYICENHSNVFLDTKKILGNWAQKAKYIKINNYEYERSKESIPKSVKDKIICTKGERGATFMGELYPVADKVEVKDTSGAGDSFFAALLVKYIETEDIKSAIKFANECASEVVKRKGVTAINIPF
jgi:D-beta-D-heptose 7-phosphate kinase/D-beta-D-heptose 1-phosphate adenosyltransferase